MSTTIATTRNVPLRFRGFLASCMLEITPGVYVAPRLKKSVRERIWDVMLEWSELLDSDAGVAFFWRSRRTPSGLGMKLIGWPQKELLEQEGVWLALRNLTEAHDRDELEELLDADETSASDSEAHPELPDSHELDPR